MSYHSYSMASLLQIGSPLIYSSALVKTIPRSKSFTCTTVAKTTPGDEYPVVPRRSANYQPSLWDKYHLLPVENKYAKDKSVRGERDLLKEEVRMMLNDGKTSYLDQLELIDDLQKLGVSYHFEREIKNILTVYYQEDRRIMRQCDIEKDLHATALEFRLFRQRGFNVSEDVLDIFMENHEKFESDDLLQNNNSETLLLILIVMQILGLVTYERWWSKRPNKNLVLVEFAKIDFNIVQAIHQEELKYVSSWWRETGLGHQLHFARDRIVENYFWTIGQIQEPQFGNVRRTMTKVNALLTTIDDIYDIYGTLEELQLFTVAFENWDVNRLDDLPEYMRLCFLVVYNEVNTIGCDILRNKNINVIPFLRKADELERGDVSKSIQCYMNETGASGEQARVHVRQMINDMWDEMNYEKMGHSASLLPEDFMETVINLARMSQCMYQYGDGHGSPEKAKIVDHVMSLLFDPIPLD
ncbi:unnamed protein product [Thlaspi arvense]|uniref:Uncharacterized protein n=1 Tax=Thlaspi arvense TaxID=13288 RepID=A0AAU9SA62_THLAR|nr:unnamed protein product [Thlaspi arvense]